MCIIIGVSTSKSQFNKKLSLQSTEYNSSIVTAFRVGTLHNCIWPDLNERSSGIFVLCASSIRFRSDQRSKTARRIKILETKQNTNHPRISNTALKIDLRGPSSPRKNFSKILVRYHKHCKYSSTECETCFSDTCNFDASLHRWMTSSQTSHIWKTEIGK